MVGRCARGQGLGGPYHGGGRLTRNTEAYILYILYKMREDRYRLQSLYSRFADQREVPLPLVRGQPATPAGLRAQSGLRRGVLGEVRVQELFARPLWGRRPDDGPLVRHAPLHRDMHDMHT